MVNDAPAPRAARIQSSTNCHAASESTPFIRSTSQVRPMAEQPALHDCPIPALNHDVGPVG